VTPEQLHEMMHALMRERDETRSAIADWPELKASDGAATVSAGIRDAVERIRQMMRQAAQIIEGIDGMLPMYPKNFSPEVDARREVVLADRREMLQMWSDLAGMAEQLTESLMALSRLPDDG
jgi:hypothetical protein